jgi:IS605 OrfB family transposase
LDKLQSEVSKPELRHRRRHRLKKAMQRARVRIRNLVDDCHHKVVKELCLNYTTILLPLFETSQMVLRISRRIRKKTVRMMLTWSHYRFRQTLLNKSREYPWVEVIVVGEAYTSKTCGKCGQLHNKLGGNKVFTCPFCKFTVDRDVNGARNILLKFLTEHERAEDVRHWVQHSHGPTAANHLLEGQFIASTRKRKSATKPTILTQYFATSNVAALPARLDKDEDESVDSNDSDDSYKENCKPAAKSAALSARKQPRRATTRQVSYYENDNCFDSEDEAEYDTKPSAK